MPYSDPKRFLWAVKQTTAPPTLALLSALLYFVYIPITIGIYVFIYMYVYMYMCACYIDVYMRFERIYVSKLRMSVLFLSVPISSGPKTMPSIQLSAKCSC